ncbi:MAG: phosphatidic acid phosphatase, partial [Polaribacter sp.]
MTHLKFKLYTVFMIGTFLSCQKPSEPIKITPDVYHIAVDKITEIMIHDIFSPPVASRIFAYPNVAAYEILTQKDKKYSSLTSTVNELKPIPKIEESQQINTDLAALIAHIEVSKTLIFSEDKFNVLQDSLYNHWELTNEKEFRQSKKYALKVVKHIKEWMNADNYNQTRTMPKFSVDTDDPSRWQPTPPAYIDGIEPHWNKIRPFLLKSANQFKPKTHPKFSLEKDSKFYKELLEVYEISKEITKKGDSSEEVQ